MTHPVPGDGDSKVLTRVPLTPGLQTEQPLPFRLQSLYRSGLGGDGSLEQPPDRRLLLHIHLQPVTRPVLCGRRCLPGVP